MKRGLNELDQELGDGERTLFLLEQVHQTLPPIFDRRAVAVGSQFLLDLLSASLLLGDVQLQELDVVGDRRCTSTLGAKIVETQRCLDGAVYDMLGLKGASFVEEVPLVVILTAIFGGSVEEGVIVE